MSVVVVQHPIYMEVSKNGGTHKMAMYIHFLGNMMVNQWSEGYLFFSDKAILYHIHV